MRDAIEGMHDNQIHQLFHGDGTFIGTIEAPSWLGGSSSLE